MRNLFYYLLIAFALSELYGQLTVTGGYNAAQMVSFLVGSGVTVSNPSMTGDPMAFGRFTTGSNPTNLGLTSGIVLTTGSAIGSPPLGSPVTNFASTNNSGGSDPQLASLIGATINDAAVLEFDFVPISDTIKFRYVFGSEEYPEWVGSSYNDVFGFFITGPNPSGGNYTNFNIARIPNTTLPVSINNINGSSYAQYYVDNQGLNGQTIVYDGFTKVLTAWAKVVPCSTYHMKIAIGDAGDDIYDSGVFLEENSFSSPTVSISQNFIYGNVIGNYLYEGGCNDLEVCISVSNPSPQPITITYTSTGSATPGIDFTFPSSITIPPYQTSVCLTVTAPEDNIQEGSEIATLIFQSTVACATSQNVLSFEIRDYPALTLSMPNDTFVCGDTIPLKAIASGGIPPYHYQWNTYDTTQTTFVSPTSPANYVVTVTDFCGKTSTGDVFVNLGLAQIDLGPDTAICAGNSITLNAPPASSYHWSTGETSQSITVSPSQTTTYYLTIVQQCEGTDSITVEVLPNPIISLNVQPQLICEKEPIQLTASGGITYQWASIPPTPDLINFSNSFIELKPSSSTTYIVTGIDAHGCSNSASASVTVKPNPEAAFITQPSQASSFDPTFYFYDVSTGNPTIWIWTLGDGSTYNTPSFSHQFPLYESGTYEVLLYVENEAGCSDTVKGYVTVTPDHTLYIPSAFTPNNDGKNDYFHIAGIDFPMEDFHLWIYNRWGQLVYNTSDPGFAWDGKVNGSPVPNGVYMIYIKFRDHKNIYHFVEQNLNIMR